MKIAFQDWLTTAANSVAGQIRVSVKTNLGPAFTVYDGAAEGPGLAAALGLKMAFTVHGPDGNAIATYGTPPPTEPARVVLVLALLAGLAFVLIRGVHH